MFKFNKLTTLFGLLLVMTCLQVGHDTVFSTLALKTDMVNQGQLWRIVSGQFVHFNFNHLLLNGGGLIFIWLLHGHYYNNRQFLSLVLGLSVFIGLLIQFSSEPNHTYAGFSGVLHGLIFYGAMIDVVKKEKTAWLLLLGIVVKVGYEMLIGASEQTKSLIEVDVAVNAHFFGIVSAILIAVFTLKSHFPKMN